MKYTEPVAIRISPQQLEDLKKIADRTETSVSAIIRQAIKAFLVDNV